MSRMGLVAIKTDDLSLAKYKCYFCDLDDEKQKEIADQAYQWYLENGRPEQDETPHFEPERVAQL